MQPPLWVMERTLAWLVPNRYLPIDDEHRVQMSETLIEVAIIRIMPRRPALRR